MVDFLTLSQRSELMSKVRGKETSIEQGVRSRLHKKGFRFRKNVGRLPGKPDIVLRKYNAVIFINGCFWHGHHNCAKSKLPSTRKEFWDKKISDNLERDWKNIELLKVQGWRVAVLWQCELKKKKNIILTMDKVFDWLSSNRSYLEIPPD
jgi:DNA mismatch endonuclease, patch repair protein